MLIFWLGRMFGGVRDLIWEVGKFRIEAFTQDIGNILGNNFVASRYLQKGLHKYCLTELPPNFYKECHCQIIYPFDSLHGETIVVGGIPSQYLQHLHNNPILVSPVVDGHVSM